MEAMTQEEWQGQEIGYDRTRQVIRKSVTKGGRDL